MLVRKRRGLKGSFVRKDCVWSDEAEKRFLEEKMNSFFGKEKVKEPPKKEESRGIEELRQFHQTLVQRQNETNVSGDSMRLLLSCVGILLHDSVRHIQRPRVHSGE